MNDETSVYGAKTIFMMVFYMAHRFSHQSKSQF